MRRSGRSAAVWARLAAVGLLWASFDFAGVARAESMDPALSRLRIVGGVIACPTSRELEWCRNQESYERLVSQIGVSIAPSLRSPARSVGPRGFALVLDMTLTTVDANASYWKLGSEGSSGRAEGGNDSPDPVLAWTRAEVRKGLPLGFEVGGSVAKGHATSLWALSLSLKWAIIEGFRTGIGALPDVALSASTTRSMGLEELSLGVHTADVVLSKPLHAGQGFLLSPMLGLQLMFLEAHSPPVDLTPGPSPTMSTHDVDGFAACRPVPNGTTRDAPLVCSSDGSGEDFVNNVKFDDVSHSRARLFLGGQAQHGIWRFAASLGFDLIAPTLAAERTRPIHTSKTLGRQVAITIAAGAAL